MNRATMGTGGVIAAILLVVGTASAATAPTEGPTTVDPGQAATATATPTATPTPRPGGPPADRGNGNRPDSAGPGNRPDTAGQGNRPGGTGPAGASASGASGATGATGPASNRPQLPPQASPRAKAAVEAAGKKHELLRDRLAALKAISKDADRSEAVKAVMADFGALFHLVSDAVHSVDPSKATPTPTGTATATATGAATATATGTATASATPTSTPTATATSTALP